MNKREKEVLQAQLDKEKAVLEELKKQYARSLREIEQKTKVLMFDIQQLDETLNTDGLDDRSKEVLESRKQSKIYQKQHQEALKKQVEAITEKLHSDEYSTIEQYLKECYTDAYVGTMYDISGQGIPVITPIDQTAVVRAVMTDSKISEGLYTALGVDTKALKIAISAEISRGIATGQSYAQIAKNLNGVANTKYGNAMRIVRTEGHRIQNASAYDAQQAAKAKGCNVVKQWDSTLDGKTRPTHRELDGQIREVEEYFEAAGKKAKYPGDFGDPAEDCNCRCTTLTRAKWALGEEELKTLQDRARFFGLDKTESFEDYKKKYLKVAKVVLNDTASETLGSEKTKDFEELSSYMKANYGINLTKKVQALDFEAVKDAITGVEWTIHQFPEANRYLKKIDSNKKGGVMNCTGDVIACSPTAFSGHYYSGNHEFFKSTGVHEATHMVEGYLISKDSTGTKEFVEMWNNHSVAKSIVKEAVSNLPNSMTDGKKYWEIYETISPYASTNASECVAEAVADIYKNGDNASILSQEIFKILKGKM